MATKLTKRSVDALEAAEKRRRVYDAELPGFGVWVEPSGAKSFFVQYRTPGGRSGKVCRYRLGKYGPMTVDQARDLARRALAQVAAGEDPAAARREQAAAPTVAALGADFLDDVRARRKLATAKEYARAWATNVVPELGTKQVAAVTTADVAALHRKLRATPYQANRVLALLGSFFSYAEQQGERPKHTNPAHDVEPYPEHGRERFLTPAEVAKLGEVLERAEREGLPPAPTKRRKPEKRKRPETVKHRPKSADAPKPANPFGVALIRFLLLSGWREGEARTLQWAWIDDARGQVVLPDTKTGKSVRPIGAPALELLDELPRIEGSPYVFPGADPARPLADVARLWYAVRHAAGLGDVRIHDLRHSFASAVASAGGSLLMIRALLGHKDTTTSAKYAHLMDDPVRATADATAAQVAGWLRTSPGTTPAAVVPIIAARGGRKP